MTISIPILFNEEELKIMIMELEYRIDYKHTKEVDTLLEKLKEEYEILKFMRGK